MFINGTLCSSGVAVQFNKNALQRFWVSPRNSGWGIRRSNNILGRIFSISSRSPRITKKPNKQQSLKSLQTLTCKVGVPIVLMLFFFLIETVHEFHMKNQFPGVQLPAEQFHLCWPLMWLIGRAILWSSCMGQGANVSPKNCEEGGVLLLSWISTVLWAVWRDFSI